MVLFIVVMILLTSYVITTDLDHELKAGYFAVLGIICFFIILNAILGGGA